MKLFENYLTTMISGKKNKREGGEKVNEIHVMTGKGDTILVELYRSIGKDAGCSITAYCNEETLGVIDAICRENSYYDIDQFWVRADMRTSGLGRALFAALVNGTETVNIEEIHVKPHPEYCEWNPPICIQRLYEIYKKLGFVFVDNELELDISKPDHDMIYKRKRLCD